MLRAQALETGAALSIPGLRGLGKELWQGVDAASRVADERKAWR